MPRNPACPQVSKTTAQSGDCLPLGIGIATEYAPEALSANITAQIFVWLCLRRFGVADQDEPAVAAIFGVEFGDGVGSGSGTSKKIEYPCFLVSSNTKNSLDQETDLGVLNIFSPSNIAISSFVASVAVPTSFQIVKIFSPFPAASNRKCLYCGLPVPCLPKTIRPSFRASRYLSSVNLQWRP